VLVGLITLILPPPTGAQKPRIRFERIRLEQGRSHGSGFAIWNLSVANAKAIVNHLPTAVDSFIGEAEPHADLTIVVMHV
jgi:hypothetical protein